MSRGRPGPSDTERELFNLKDGGGYVRIPPKPAERPGTHGTPTPSAMVMADEQSAIVPEITGSASMQIVAPTDTAPPVAASVIDRRTGRIQAVYTDRDFGFIRMSGDERDIHFSNKTCFGLLRALRPDDEVTFC